jgi:hypothetical protein
MIAGDFQSAHCPKVVTIECCLFHQRPHTSGSGPVNELPNKAKFVSAGH